MREKCWYRSQEGSETKSQSQIWEKGAKEHSINSLRHWIHCMSMIYPKSSFEFHVPECWYEVMAKYQGMMIKDNYQSYQR